MYFIANTELLKKAKRFFKETEIIQFEEIGDGILAVRTKDYFDIFFDTGRWKLTIKIKSEFQSIIFPDVIEFTGILPGRFIKNGVATKERALLVVKQKLVPLAPYYRLVGDPVWREKKESGPLDGFMGEGFEEMFEIVKDLFSKGKRT
jgi:hypothetical protein